MQYQVCRDCLVDTSVPRAVFDADGVCNFCRLHHELEHVYPLGEEGQRRLTALISDIKKRGRRTKYDCIVGISGGRDSTYTLYLAKKFGLRPLAVHFNDGFGNPVAGENMTNSARILDVDVRTITSDWRESKSLKIACLKASIPNANMSTDIGLAAALYGVAAEENVRTILIGQSFRTEGIAPLDWNYLDGKFLKSIHKLFGTFPLRKWRPTDPGFNLGPRQIAYYALIKRIKVIPILYYVDYVRKDVDKIISNELSWTDTGAHYFDDLYQALLQYVQRVKFNLDRRRFNYSALVRSKQMARDEGLEKLKEIYALEDPKIIDLCTKRLGITRAEFDDIMRLPPKTFRDYETSFDQLQQARPLIKILAEWGFVPKSTYKKYFEF